jgi:hypothetical protein
MRYSLWLPARIRWQNRLTEEEKAPLKSVLMDAMDSREALVMRKAEKNGKASCAHVCSYRSVDAEVVNPRPSTSQAQVPIFERL